MDYTYFCRMFYSATRIPLNLLQSGRVLYSSLGEELNYHLIQFWKVAPHTQNPYLSSNKPDISYGLFQIEDKDMLIVVGPAFSTPVTDEVVYQYMRQIGMDPGRQEKVASVLQAIPLTTHFRFCYILSFLHFCLNHKTTSAEQLYRESSTDRRIRQDLQEKTKASGDYLYDYQSTYHFEQDLYRLIRTGSPERLIEYLDHFPSNLQPSVLAAMPLRSAKNLFISIASKASVLGMVQGGVSAEQAQLLLDLYIRECETAQTVDDVMRLGYSMLLDFCRKAQEAQIPEQVSDEIHRCLVYIRGHIFHQISVEDVAHHVYRSSACIMKRFREETGKTIGEYIMIFRLEEAKNMLLYSSMSLSGISYALCFSSQSHFQNVFKKHFHCTPRQYREKERMQMCM